MSRTHSSCTRCGRPMLTRAERGRGVVVPGGVAYGGQGECNTCRQRQRRSIERGGGLVSGLRPTFPELDGTQACADVDPELFFPVSATRDLAQVVDAKTLCAACPLRRPCLAYALTNAVHGIWGGTTEAERVALQRLHGLPRRVQWSGSSHDQQDPTAIPVAVDSTDFDDSEERP